MQILNKHYISGSQLKKVLSSLNFSRAKKYHIRLEVNEDKAQIKPSLTDLSNVAGPNCFTSVQAIDKHIRKLRAEWI